MQRLRCLVIAAVLGCACNAAAANRPPLRATIAQLLRAPDRYALKAVRVRGQVDNCVSYTCHICPDDMTRETLDIAKCIAMSFDGFAPGGTYREGELSEGRVSDAMENSFRFATVTMDFDFDPTCLTNKDYSHKPLKKNELDFVVCTDRATVLSRGHVVAVHARKSVLDGLITGYVVGPLTTVPPDEAAAMGAIFLDYAPNFAGRPMRALAIAGASAFGAKFQQDGLLCVCRLDDCDGKWPTQYIGGFESPANPFDCHAMVKRDGQWSAVPH